MAASLLTAVIMGWAWARWGRSEWITRRLPPPGARNESRWVVFAEAARHDFLQAASYLVLGAAAAAVFHVVVPPWVFGHLASHLILGVAVMAVLAVVLALCSEADAFVAASMTMVPLLPRLVFLVVGPAVDLKLFAMQAGMFGRAFAVRFAPSTFRGCHRQCVCRRAVGARWWLVSRETENTVLMLVGISIAMIAVSGAFTRYVKPGLLPWLIASAVLLIALALVAIVGDIRRGGPRTGDHGDDALPSDRHRVAAGRPGPDPDLRDAAGAAALGGGPSDAVTMLFAISRFHRCRRAARRNCRCPRC